MDLLEQRAKNVLQEQWLNGARQGANWLSSLDLPERAKNVLQEQWLNGGREGADSLSWSDSPQRAEEQEPAAPHSSGQSIPRKSHLMGARTESRKRPSGRKYDKRAGEEVRTEMHHMREGKHPVKNGVQAIAIGLSKARKKGEKVPPPPGRSAA